MSSRCSVSSRCSTSSRFTAVLNVLVVLEAPLASHFDHTFDVTATCAIGFLWLLIQIWYIVRVCQFLRENARQMHLMTIAETIRNQQKIKLQQSLTKVAC